MKEENETLKKLLDLDWVTAHELDDPDSVADLSVLDACEYEGRLYLLSADAGSDEDIPEDDAADDPSEGPDQNAYIFLLCPEEEAEFYLTCEVGDGEETYPVTTVIEENDFNAVAAIFGHSDDYDVVIEEGDK